MQTLFVASRPKPWRPITSAIVLLVFAAACAVDEPTATHVPSRPSFGKAPAGVAVTSTNPSYAHRGDTQVSVHVYGSGFAAGARAQWSLGGDTTSVTTSSTLFVSSTELVAVITVAGTAPLALYDVSVTNRDGKKGVGAELFAVTTATVVGPGTLGGDVIVNEINDLGQVVGYFDQAGPFVTDSNTIISLGSTGQAWGISPSGDVVVGRDNAPIAWVRQASGAYVKETLPSLFAVGGGAMHATAGPGGELLVAGYRTTSVSKQGNTLEPVVWTRTGTMPWSTTVYTQPWVQAGGHGISSIGRMMGHASFDSRNGSWGVWDSPSSTFVPLNAPYLQAINDAGTVVVGVTSAGAALWYRDVVTGLWNPNAVQLPLGSPPCSDGGSAQDINNDGVIVGYACGSAAAWRIDPSKSPPAFVSGPLLLVGLGTKGTNAASRADAVTNTRPYVVAGRATSGGRGLLVKWTIDY
jgi:hypothetical protein